MGVEEKDKSVQREAICRAAREWMLKLYKDEAMVALRYYSDGPVGRTTLTFNADEDVQHVSHIRNCEQCTLWVRGYAGERWMERQQRLAQCCCPRMFGFVEDEKRKTRDALLEFRKVQHPHPDVEWLWYMRFYYLETNVMSYQVNYCPWCGEPIKIPDNA